MSGRLPPVAIALSLMLGLMFVPSSMADCPEVPQHCRSSILERLSPGDSKLDTGAYEDDPVRTEGNSKLLAAYQASNHEPESDGDGELEAGETGGVLIIINETGNATQLTVTLDPNPTGITYLDGNVLVIDDPQQGSYHVIPFRVDNVTDGLGLSITVEDQDGETDSAQLHPFGLPVLATDNSRSDELYSPSWYEEIGPAQWVAIAAVALGTALVVMFFMRRIKK